MHERFFLLADLLAFAYAFAARDKTSVGLAFLAQDASILALARANSPRESVLTAVGACLALAAILVGLFSLPG